MASETEDGVLRANAYFGGRAARRRLTPQAAQRHTVLVRNLRLAVPAAAASLVIAYALSATPPEVDMDFLRQFEDIEATSAEMRLERPRYVGSDSEGSAFEVSAYAAKRNPDDPDVVRLENPEALRGVGGTGEATRVRAVSGRLDTAGKTVDLEDDVELVQGSGANSFTLRTDKARIDLDRRTISTAGPVRGSGERGALEADGATVYEDEERLVLEGNVKLRFDPASGRTQAAGGALRN
jgi:lipopolysaccharide export system protein LptC